MSRINENPALRALNAKKRIQEGTKIEEKIATENDALTERLKEIQDTKSIVDSAQELFERIKAELDHSRQDLQEVKKEYDIAKINLVAAKQATTKATEDINKAVSDAKNTVIKVELSDQAKKDVEERNGTLVTSLSNAIDGQKGQWAKTFQSQKEEVKKMCEANNGVYCSDNTFWILMIGWFITIAFIFTSLAVWISLKCGWLTVK